jgi:hypothetical protein
MPEIAHEIKVSVEIIAGPNVPWFKYEKDLQPAHRLRIRQTLADTHKLKWILGSNTQALRIAFQRWPFEGPLQVINQNVEARVHNRRQGIFKYTVYAQLTDGTWVHDDPDIEIQDDTGQGRPRLLPLLFGAAIGGGVMYALSHRGDKPEEIEVHAD